MKTFAHQRPVRDAAGEITGQIPAPARRVTVAPLGGAFGSDKKHRLVVTLKAGDVIELRPEKTQRAVTVKAFDIYRLALQAQAARHVADKRAARKAGMTLAEYQRSQTQ